MEMEMVERKNQMIQDKKLCGGSGSYPNATHTVRYRDPAGLFNALYLNRYRSSASLAK